MRKIYLVTGGARSGKSTGALRLGESLPGPRAFIATCRPTDEEMGDRILLHKKHRDSKKWETFEEEQDLGKMIKRCSKFPVILIDCLTLWVYNLMEEAEKNKRSLDFEDLMVSCTKVFQVCKKQNGTIIFVTNELGLGIVPDNPAVRKYRDLIGSLNQFIGNFAYQIIFMVCGQPMYLKNKKNGD